MLLNRLRFVFLGLFMVLLSGCSSSSSKISDFFSNFGTSVYKLLIPAAGGQPYVILGFMFFAMVIGFFALFKGLLRFAFSGKFNSHGTDMFGKKEINVLSLMLSIIGVTGIFFIFRNDASVLVTYFGGTVGFLFVLFIVILIMKTFLEFAKSFEVEDGALGKGPAWIFIMLLGAIVSMFLVLGYVGQILKSLGCNLGVVSGNVYCAGLVHKYNLFFVVYNHGSTIMGWLLFFAVIFGIFWLMKANKGNDSVEVSSSSSSGGGDGGFLGKVFGSKKKSSLSDEDKKNAGEMKEHVEILKKGLNEIVKSTNKQRDILNKAYKKFESMDNKGGNN